MLQLISPLKGFAIQASDGRIGTVVDFLFDDASWKVRWLVVDCGTWLSGRRVLISVGHFARGPGRAAIQCWADEGAGRRQPRIGRSSAGLSANGKSALQLLWLGPARGRPNLSAIPGAMASPLMAPPYLGLGSTDAAEARSDGPTSRGADPHLRSVVEVTGYRVHAVDGEIGHIENSHDRRRGTGSSTISSSTPAIGGLESAC